jgi:hypothetical protein
MRVELLVYRAGRAGDSTRRPSYFETFPFPEPTDEQREAIAEAARELDRLRMNWLNPPEWVREEVLEFPGSVDGPWRRYIASHVSPDSPSPPAPLPQGARGDRATEMDGARGDRVRGMEGEAKQHPHPGPLPGGEGEVGMVRYPRLVARDAECAKKLAKRTLTNLYNERPTWLDLAHRKLDEAVFAAYGWPASMSDDELLAKLLDLNLRRSS